MEYVLKKAFPPLNEMTVFIFTVTLYSLSLYVDGWPNPLEIAVGFLSLFFNKIESFNDLIVALVMAGIMTAIAVAFIVAPLLLPFVKKKYDLRFFCLFVIYVDALIVFASSIISLVYHLQVVCTILPVYSFAWIAYLSHITKFSRRQVEPMDYIMDDTQTTALDASAAAIASVLVVLFLIFLIKVSSVDWYMRMQWERSHVLL